jgi:ferredoxin-NADP reductase
VSPFLWQLKPGDEIEIRGPIGGHFVWDITNPDPLVLIAGGSGMVPLMCMLRHHANHVATVKRKVYFIISLRTFDRLLYKDELDAIQSLDKNVKVAITLTDSAPPDWNGYTGRIHKDIFLKELEPLKGKMADIYVCGPTGFVEAAGDLLLETGFNSHLIRTERFGG